jgi:phosphoglycolate phosphatase-like HAD superfamily hydrolase
VGDIRCGQAIGATTIAYSAGFQPPEKLKPENPDHMTDDLGDVPAIIAQLRKDLG